MSLDPSKYLKHIRDEIIYLENTSEGLEYEHFLKDPTLIRAFARSLEIRGEASKKASDDYKATHSKIEWKAMAGMGDKLIHDYFGVDFELVWEVIKNHLPELKTKIQKIL